MQNTLSSKILMTNHVAFMPYWANRQLQAGVDVPGNPSRFDIATQRFSGPSPEPYNYYKENLELQGNIQFYQPWGSKHDLKAGYLKDWSYTGYNRYNHESGNYQLRFDGGAPLQIVTYNYPLIAKRESAMQSFAAYVQDQWSASFPPDGEPRRPIRTVSQLREREHEAAGNVRRLGNLPRDGPPDVVGLRAARRCRLRS